MNLMDLIQFCKTCCCIWRVKKYDRSGNNNILYPYSAREVNIVKHLQGYPLERHELCTLSFTEETAQWTLPINEVNIVCDFTMAEDMTPLHLSRYLEVTDHNSKKLKYIPVPRPKSIFLYTSWLSKISETDVLLAPLGNKGVVTVDSGGTVRLWETGLDNLQRSLHEWRNMIGQEDGQPVQGVLVNNIKRLFELRLTISEIARRLDISRNMVYRLMDANGISWQKFTSINDATLKEEIKDIKKCHMHAGEVFINGHLRARGIYVQRHRLRTILHEVDPEGIAVRKRPTISRRVYYSPCPNYVWHLDGLHKLIRWKLVIHGAIDGFSRLILFLACSTNNKSDTVYSLFQNSVHVHGWPIHVRTDLGGENQKVWQVMTDHHRTAASVIRGSSVHNERIERLWRDINRLISSTFRSVFYNLENICLLDPLNDTDLFCLHWVFKKFINNMLSDHIKAHNNHSLSTESNYTPLQLHELNNHLTDLHLHNPSEEENSIEEVHLTQVEVPDVRINAPPELLEMLTAEIPQDLVNLNNCEQLYEKAVNIVGQFIAEKQMN